MKPNSQFKKFIEPYYERIQNLTMELRNFITDLVPESNELIWEAVEISENLNTELTEKNTRSKSIVMYISEKKLRWK